MRRMAEAPRRSEPRHGARERRTAFGIGDDMSRVPYSDHLAALRVEVRDEARIDRLDALVFALIEAGTGQPVTRDLLLSLTDRGEDDDGQVVILATAEGRADYLEVLSATLPWLRAQSTLWADTAMTRVLLDPPRRERLLRLAPTLDDQSRACWHAAAAQLFAILPAVRRSLKPLLRRLG